MTMKVNKRFDPDLSCLEYKEEQTEWTRERKTDIQSMTPEDTDTKTRKSHMESLLESLFFTRIMRVSCLRRRKSGGGRDDSKGNLFSITKGITFHFFLFPTSSGKKRMSADNYNGKAREGWTEECHGFFLKLESAMSGLEISSSQGKAVELETRFIRTHH